MQAEFEPGGKLNRIKAALDDPKRALKQIGILGVAESQGAFRSQRFGANTWPTRGVPNVFGIIADFAAGRTAPPNRRFDPRPALIDTGGLRGSLAYRPVGQTTVEWGTVKTYAAVHQTGGPIESEVLDADTQARIARWLRRQPELRQRQLGFLTLPSLKGTRIQGRVPARPFVGITETTRKNVDRAVGVHIFEAK